MFPIVAEKYAFVVGVDTHARKHVSTIVNKFIGWSLKVTGAEDKKILFAVEGTSSYGETLTNALLARGLPVTEVRPPKTKSRGGSGKTDRIDSELAAIGVLRLPVHKLVLPRTGHDRKLLRILLGSRRMMVAQQTASKNALIALLRSTELGVDARRPLSRAGCQAIAHWKLKDNDQLRLIKYEARRLAKSILSLAGELQANKAALHELSSKLAPELLDEPGIGPVTLAQIICSYSHKGRIRSAEAFASLAGTAPIPASSGNTVHYRLNHYGDRQLNHALTTIVLSRMRADEKTMQYVAKRTANGLSVRDIKRSLKRYVARSLFKRLEACNIMV